MVHDKHLNKTHISLLSIDFISRIKEGVLRVCHEVGYVKDLIILGQKLIKCTLVMFIYDLEITLGIYMYLRREKYV